MANVLTNSLALGGTSSGLLARVKAAYANYRLYRRTIAELRSLSNRELQDLGLSRFTIKDVARDAVYGR